MTILLLLKGLFHLPSCVKTALMISYKNHTHIHALIWEVSSSSLSHFRRFIGRGKWYRRRFIGSGKWYRRRFIGSGKWYRRKRFNFFNKININLYTHIHAVYMGLSNQFETNSNHFYRHMNATKHSQIPFKSIWPKPTCKYINRECSSDLETICV